MSVAASKKLGEEGTKTLSESRASGSFDHPFTPFRAAQDDKAVVERDQGIWRGSWKVERTRRGWIASVK
jgi:hypothetical protein